MIKHEKSLIALMLVLCGTGAAWAVVDSYVVDRDKLPEAAQQMRLCRN